MSHLSDLELDVEQQRAEVRRLRVVAREQHDHWILHMLDHIIGPSIAAGNDFAAELKDISAYSEVLTERRRVRIESPPPPEYYEQLWHAMAALSTEAIGSYWTPEKYTRAPQGDMDKRHHYCALQKHIFDIVTEGSDTVLSEQDAGRLDEARHRLIPLTESCILACMDMPDLTSRGLHTSSPFAERSEVEEALMHRNKDLARHNGVNDRPDLDFHFLYWRNHLLLGVLNTPWLHGRSEV